MSIGKTTLFNATSFDHIKPLERRGGCLRGLLRPPMVGCDMAFWKDSSADQAGKLRPTGDGEWTASIVLDRVSQRGLLSQYLSPALSHG